MPQGRSFQESHPWLSFDLDLRKVDHECWIRLGEAQAKVELLAQVPLLPDFARKLMQVSVARGVLATTAIEGNTLTEDQVLAHLKGELQLPPSKEYLRQEIENIIAACNGIADRLLGSGSADLDSTRIRHYNARVLENLPKGEEVEPGCLRHHSVGVGRYRGAPAEDLEYLVDRLCDWLHPAAWGAPVGRELAYGVLRAIVAHLYIAWIHPFGDGNGRTARLVEFHILLEAGVPDVAAHLLSNHYNATRDTYYRELDAASRTRSPFGFIRYALQGFVEELDQQIHRVLEQQIHVLWINFIHDCFRERDGKVDRRRRRLALDISRAPGPVPLKDVRTVSPRIAEAYASKTDRTMRRDIGVLQSMGLLRLDAEGATPPIEKLLALLPLTRSEQGAREP